MLDGPAAPVFTHHVSARTGEAKKRVVKYREGRWKTHLDAMMLVLRPPGQKITWNPAPVGVMKVLVWSS